MLRRRGVSGDSGESLWCGRVGVFPGLDLWEVAAKTAQDRTATAGQGEAEVKLSAGEIQRASGHFCLFPAQLAGSL